MNTKINFDALTNALNMLHELDILKDADSIKDMVRKCEQTNKEQFVLEKHMNKYRVPYKISEITYQKRGKTVTKWSTRAPWKSADAKLMKNSYAEIIDELFEHYNGGKNLSKMTVAEVYETWMKERIDNRSVSSLTIEHNKADWERYWSGRPLTSREISEGKEPVKRAAILDMKITDVTVGQVREHFEYLTKDRTMTRKTFTNLKSVINAVFAYAYDWGIPCIDVKRISTARLRFKAEKDNSDQVYSDEEADKLLSYLESLPVKSVYILAIRLMFTLCCRIGELRALTWDDIDYKSYSIPVIRLQHQIVDLAEGNIQRRATDVDYMKGHSRTGKRFIPLSKTALQILDELRAYNPDSHYICSSKGYDEPIRTNKFNEHLKHYCEEAGVPYYSSHKIRFYVVSKLYDENVPEKDIQRLAGHSDVVTTRHYNRRIKEVDLSDEMIQNCFGRKHLEPEITA